MKHIIIQIESIFLYPPTLSLLRMLKYANDDEVILLSSHIDNNVMEFCALERIKLFDIGISYNQSESTLFKLLKLPFIRYQIKKYIKKLYDCNSLIWIMTSITLKYLGTTVIGKRYILYLYELALNIRYYPKLAYPKLHLSSLLHGATAVIECEYNRAHILKAWFNLRRTPYVLPNKPFMRSMHKKSYINSHQHRILIEKLKEKKIILYQGIIDAERPLNKLISAVDELGEEYALVIMSKDYKKLQDIPSNNMYLMPFLSPPEHLEVTSWAHIGILTYYPVYNGTTSPLNAIYCAPNKLFEFAMFGIPMLGNNIPGLTYSITYNHMGVCFEKYDEESIIYAIQKIELNYNDFSCNALKYYENIDNHQTITNILNSLKVQGR